MSNASVNLVILVGNLGKDPELKETKSGNSVATFSMATTESWKDKGGNKQEKTEWHNIVVWGKLGELCAKYLKKGRSCYVQGKLTTRSWDGDDGVKHYKTEVVGTEVKFLGGGDGKKDDREDDGFGEGYGD